MPGVKKHQPLSEVLSPQMERKNRQYTYGLLRTSRLKKEAMSYDDRKNYPLLGKSKETMFSRLDKYILQQQICKQQYRNCKT
jgi:hypothetical protein